MHRLGTFTLAAFVILTPVATIAQQVDQPAASSTHWLEVRLKARSMLVDPASPDVLHEVMDPLPEPMGLLSPDGTHVTYVGSDPQRVKEGHDFDVFVADVDLAQPSAKANMRRVTTDQLRPTNVCWTKNGGGLVFLAGEEAAKQVWFADLAPTSKPVLLSDGVGSCSDPKVLADGSIAWACHTGNKGKQQFVDLVVHPSPSIAGKSRKALTGEHISSYAFSPDGAQLAWSGLGSLFIVDVATGASREIPLQSIHRQLLNHSAYAIAWRSDGKVIAIHCGFLGGIARGLNADPNEPWPRMFAEDKVFFVPKNWTPSPELLHVGEGDQFPSPMVDDPKAEVSPPAGDESKPWWVRELPMRPIELKWITADEVQSRIKNSA